MGTNRPLVFVDLDDTLFQTSRKMVEGTPRTTATLDVHGQPNGYMNPIQHSFISWLLASADVVPVTARDVEAYCRFQKTAALNVRSRLHYSSGGVGSIRQRRAA
ncbi:hypothetical protein ACV09X_006303, partial [Pseudomonas aeruginosa]